MYTTTIQGARAAGGGIPLPLRSSPLDDRYCHSSGIFIVDVIHNIRECPSCVPQNYSIEESLSR